MYHIFCSLYSWPCQRV